MEMAHALATAQNEIACKEESEDLQGKPHGLLAEYSEESVSVPHAHATKWHQQGTTTGIPSYSLPTQVLPKQPLQEYTHAGQEAVVTAFGPASITGIRSLPDAMSNDFRHRLYEQLIASHHAEREARRHGTSTSDAAQTNRGASKPEPRPPGGASQQINLSGGTQLTGHKPITRVHPLSGAFSNIEYMPSEYGRKEVLDKFERLRSKCAQVNPTEFVVAVPPQGPKGAPSFSVYESTREPWLPQYVVDCADAHAIKEGMLAGPFVTGRRVDKLSLLRVRADECMLALCKLLSADWPTAFLQVFEDVSGGVVVSFDGTRAVAEGDLSAYMQNFARNNSVVSEYHLHKDGTQWGVVDDETQSVFYLLWPPWVRHRVKPNVMAGL